MPHDKIEGGVYCSQDETLKFRQTMEDFRLDPANPACADNCNEIEYDVLVTSNPIIPEEGCADSTELLGMRKNDHWRGYEEKQLQWRHD